MYVLKTQPGPMPVASDLQYLLVWLKHPGQPVHWLASQIGGKPLLFSIGGDMEIAELTQAMHQFVEAMGWYDRDSPKPQIPRNLAQSLVIESTEVLELFQWNQEPTDRGALASELADVMLYLLQLASLSGIDLEQAVLEKLNTNYGREW